MNKFPRQANTVEWIFPARNAFVHIAQAEAKDYIR